METTEAIPTPAATWRRYLELTKPRVVALILFTALAGMLLAHPAIAHATSVAAALAGIGLASAAGAVVNHVIEHRRDALMERTRHRPLPSGRLASRHALLFGLGLGGSGLLLLWLAVNPLTALLTGAALMGYGVVYTRFLKHSTPQNIVWGGAAGAAPPLLGWVAMTGRIEMEAVVLFLIVFVWTPPHFWPLAIHRCDDYRRAGLPMLPVVRGIPFTKAQILAYSVMLAGVTLLPFGIGMSGWIYLAGWLPLNLGFLWGAWRLHREAGNRRAMPLFAYSIFYLAALFTLLLVDHFIGPLRVGS